jgi:type I restriction enzyme R subunit
MKLIAGGVELQEKWQKTIQSFTRNIDQDDPEFITLREAFMQRFKEHGFVINSIDEFTEHSKALDEVIKKLEELQKRNTVLMKKYRGDAKFARIHKRIREENQQRASSGKKTLVSTYDETIMSVLLSIKSDIDQKVYDRNDILKKDAYFEQTVMSQIKLGMDKVGVSSEREDRVFIQSRIARQYLDQYNATYPAA